jgi:Cof subfamily protein (haloacid dehalogenase superfamily)
MVEAAVTCISYEEDAEREAVLPLEGTESSARRYRMLALDLDGTLLQSKTREMSQATVVHLQNLARRGVQNSFCTGRSVPSVVAQVQRLDLHLDPFPVVTTNGSEGVLIHPDLSMERLFSNTLSVQAANRIHDVAMKRGYQTLWYHGGSIFAHARNPQCLRLIRRFESLSKCKVVIWENRVDPSVMDSPPMRVVLLLSRRVFSNAVDDLNREFLEEDISIAPLPGFCCIELLGADVNKGKGLANLCDKLQISLSDCVAIGDGDNDYEFLQMAGLGICMKNGTARARSAANIVTQWTNNEDGVVKALEHLEHLDMLDFK